MPSVRPRSYATLEYVHSRVIQYYSQVVDLRWCISIHSCDVCPFQATDATSPFECQAIHYGICTPIRRSLLLRNPARLHQPAKCHIDIPIHILQDVATCRRNESSANETMAIVHNRQQTMANEEDGVAFLRQKRIELLQRREQERKRLQSTILRPDAQHSFASAAGDTTSATTPGSKDASRSSVASSAPSKLPVNPAPLTANPFVATTSTSKSITPMPMITPVMTPNNSSTSALLSSPNFVLFDTHPVGTAPMTVVPCRPFGTSPTCLGSVTPHNFLAAELTPSADPLASTTPCAPSVSVPLTSSSSSSLLITSLITELEALSLPDPHIASSGVTKSRHLTTSNSLDSFLCKHDVNSNRVGSEEKFNDLTRHSGQTFVPKTSSLQLPEPFHGSSIPQFYFPAGRRASEKVLFTDALHSQVVDVFEKVDGKAKAEHMGLIAKACGLPLYWKCPLFRYASGENDGIVSLQSFLVSWKKLSEGCPDFASLFVRMLSKPDQNYLEFDDFVSFVQDVVNTHPGLAFLEDAVEFHSPYIQTVIARIFYSVNRSWSGRITVQEIQKSNLLQTICRLEEEEDINQLVDYFSYEHFYVIYCKFWELDLDHDFLLSKLDLLRHNDQAINSQIVDRIFSGAVTRNLVDGKLSFPDFVWFLISEEDKQHPRSVEYWFRCMDVDGDGILSMYELECFYTEQVEKMNSLGIDVLPFSDCLCQMLDMIRPKEKDKIRLSDLKSCPLAPTFFDTFINLDKYLEHEQRDPFTSLRDPIGDHLLMTDWERFAADEYEMLLAENSSSDYYTEETQVWPDRLPLDPSRIEQQSQLSSNVTEPSRIVSNKPIIGYSNNICCPEEAIQVIQSNNEFR